MSSSSSVVRRGQFFAVRVGVVVIIKVYPYVRVMFSRELIYRLQLLRFSMPAARSLSPWSPRYLVRAVRLPLHTCDRFKRARKACRRSPASQMANAASLSGSTGEQMILHMRDSPLPLRRLSLRQGGHSSAEAAARSTRIQAAG